jgi:iron complex transport system permease protein
MKKPAVVITLLCLLNLAVLIIAPAFGIEWISPSILLNSDGGMNREIFINLRIPRVLTAWLAGAALAISGMAFQSLFRNPLATPFTLGVSSGAALGAAIYIRLGLTVTVFGISGLGLSAFAGALACIALVYGLTRLRGGFSAATLLLAGVAVSFFFSSLILFIQYISAFSQSQKIVRWMMGGLENSGYGPIAQMAGFTLLGGVIIALLCNELNLLMTGDEIAISRGVNAHKVKRLIFFAVSLMVGIVVAYCGPIGFVGMMAPHICRLLIGANHRTLLPASLLFGGMFLVLCDTFARSIIPPAEIPAGVITALLGGPFFIALLLNRKGTLDL